MISNWIDHIENGNRIYLRRSGNVLEFKFERPRFSDTRLSFRWIMQVAEKRGLGSFRVDWTKMSKGGGKLGLSGYVYEVDCGKVVKLYKNKFDKLKRLMFKQPLIETTVYRKDEFSHFPPDSMRNPKFKSKFITGVVPILVNRKSLKELPHSYLCSKCADKLGGQWPDGHVATFHHDTCPYCGKGESLCCVTDYLWKGDKGLRVWD